MRCRSSADAVAVRSSRSVRLSGRDGCESDPWRSRDRRPGRVARSPLHRVRRGAGPPCGPAPSTAASRRPRRSPAGSPPDVPPRRGRSWPLRRERRGDRGSRIPARCRPSSVLVPPDHRDVRPDLAPRIASAALRPGGRPPRRPRTCRRAAVVVLRRGLPRKWAPDTIGDADGEVRPRPRDLRVNDIGTAFP